MPKTVAVTLLSKPGCHLCDDARVVIEAVLADFAARGVPIAFEEVDIMSDPRLARLHAEEIPVVLVNGRRHAIWRVDAARLSAALQKRTGIRNTKEKP